MVTESSVLALIRINVKLRNAAKSAAATQGKSLQQWVEEAIEAHLTVK